MHLQEDAGFAAAGEHRVGDALGGLSVEAAALGLHHPAAPVVVGQQGQGAVGDGIGIAGGGPAVGGKERLVAGLAAAHQIRQQHGDALAGGLGDADAAGLGHQQVGAVHILGHAGGEAHGLYPQQGAHLDGVEHLAVAAAQDGGEVALRQQLVQLAGQGRHGAAADAAAHQQNVAALSGQRQRLSGGSAVRRGGEYRTGGDAGGQQRIRRDAAVDELLRQFRMGDDTDIRRAAAHGRGAGVVRGHEAEGHGCAAVLPQHGHHQGGDHVDADHGVEPLRLQVAGQAAGTPGQVGLHGVVLGSGAAVLLLGGHVARLIELGVVPVKPRVPAGDEFGCLPGDKGQTVQHAAVRAPLAERLRQGGGHRVMAAAGITGQYQNVHGFLSAALAVAAGRAAA